MKTLLFILVLVSGTELHPYDGVELESVRVDFWVPNSSVVREEQIIQIHVGPAVEDPVVFYDMFLETDIFRDSSYIVALVQRPSGPVLLKDQTIVEPQLSPEKVLVRFWLDRPLNRGQTLEIKVVMAHGNLPQAFPKKIKQGSDQLYRLICPAALYSPYRIQKQINLVHIADNRVRSFTCDLGATQFKDHIQFGPFENLDAFSIQKFYLHYSDNLPRPVFLDYRRKMTLSHWYANVIVEEEYEVTNHVPQLENEFSRVDYGHSFYHDDKVYPLTRLRFNLPKLAKFVTYRDEVGNISTSHYKVGNRFGELVVETRFPLFGGWTSRLEISYVVPNSENITYRDGKYTFSGMLLSLSDDILIRNFTFQLVLPEGATEIVSKFPFEGKDYLDRVYSHLDTSGRPTVNFHGQFLVREHSGSIQVEYVYPAIHWIWKPGLLIASVFATFLAYILYRHADPTRSLNLSQ